ncbi:BR-signaling kinase 3 [Hibiscus syriacus]|uniref:BR-signaling kinase 3 n=1 Tax=Hibiscus syriacus TaxID=106335 RepID=A0A6A3CW28_HIBSY|nr:BR-signaling kinase 3 [Hibiscus syriacus]
MEDPKAAPNPPTATANAAAPPPQPPPAAPEQPASKKRPLENSNDQYHRILRISRRVLRVSDFRNCKAADEIKEKTKHLVELYNQMLASVEKSNSAPGAGGQTLQVETRMKQKPQEQPQVIKPTPAVSSKTKILQSSSVTRKLQSDDGGEATI